MPYPQDYARAFGFASFQETHPQSPLPGDQVDVELDAVGKSTDALIVFLKKFTRSDGRLANGSVGVDQLAPDLSIGFKAPTTWEAAVQYSVSDTVFEGNKFWNCEIAHTSGGTFEPEYWSVIVDFGAQADAAAASAAAAQAAASVIGEGISLSLYATLALADAAAVAAGKPLIIDTNVTLAADTTVAATSVRFAGGRIATGAHALVINGIIGSGPVRAFDVSGGGSVVFSKNIQSHLAWFSPAGNGVTDDTVQCRAWAASSADRYADPGTYLTDTVTIPGLAAAAISGTGRIMGRLIGPGPVFTVFKSKLGADIFVPAATGSDATFLFEIGGFAGIGQGIGVGSGYVWHNPAAANFATCFEVHDIYSDLMGGGCVKDEKSNVNGAGFSAIYRNLTSNTAGKHHFDIWGGPAVKLENCYPFAVANGYCGYRIHTGAILDSCNGINGGKIWGIFGDHNADITLDAALGPASGGDPAITLPADPTIQYSGVVLLNTNIEAFTNAGIVVKNGTVTMNGSSFQAYTGTVTAAIYFGIAFNYGGILDDVIFSTSGAWANDCPIWQRGFATPFALISGSLSGDYVPCWDYFGGAVIQAATASLEYIGTADALAAVKFNALTTPHFKGATGGKFGVYGVDAVVQPTPTANVSVSAAGAGAAVKVDTTFTGGSGTAHTIGDIVAALKAEGLLKA